MAATRNRLNLRQNCDNLENQENPAGNSRLLRSKQLGGSLIARSNTNRTALGDLRNRAPQQPLDAKKSVFIEPKKPTIVQNAAVTRKAGYGAQSQSRLVPKPEARKPLRSASLKVTTVKSQECDDVKQVQRPITRQLARKSAEAAEEVKAQLPAELLAPAATHDAATDITPHELPGATDQAEVCEEQGVVSEDREEVLSSAAAYSTAMIPNIDDGDDDPQMVSDYVVDIYNYLRYLEKKQPVNEAYLDAKGSSITSRMRAILIDWMVQVHLRFHLLPETMYMTVMIMDRYLQTYPVLPKDELQLVGVTAMFIASKYEEMYAPEIGDFVYITDNSYSKQDIRLMEIAMLTALDCDLGRPLPIHFLRRFSRAANSDVSVHTMAKYFMELSLSEYCMCHFEPSYLAATSLYMALRLLRDEHQWNAALQHYTRYSESDLATGIRRLCRLLLRTHTGKSKHQAVRNKYATSKYNEISANVALNMQLVQTIIDNFTNE